MPHTPPRTLTALREHVARSVAADSLRNVADEIGMSPSSLRKLLNGGVPYAKTWAKLTDWWEVERGDPLASLTEPRISAAVERAVSRVRPERRDDARQALLATLRRLGESHPRHCPAWLSELVPGASEAGPPGSAEELATSRGAAATPGETP
jgi:hypothetical protein